MQCVQQVSPLSQQLLSWLPLPGHCRLSWLSCAFVQFSVRNALKPQLVSFELCLPPRRGKLPSGFIVGILIAGRRPAVALASGRHAWDVNLYHYGSRQARRSVILSVRHPWRAEWGASGENEC
jgi:hypothetical protein